MAKHDFEFGSATAKAGFRNEDDVVLKFNSWHTDKDAQLWLAHMKYNLQEIEFVEAVKFHGYKTDVQVQVRVKLKSAIDVQNLQVKLISNLKGFNQIDKRWVETYAKLWQIPMPVVKLLKLYTGEIKPEIANTKDKRRTLAKEFIQSDQELLLDWIMKNRILIVSDILKGRGEFCAEWMLVIKKAKASSGWVLKPINEVLNHFGTGEVYISERGTFKIGRITMQRKGGDGGRPTSNMLQFKINPAELFDI